MNAFTQNEVRISHSAQLIDRLLLLRSQTLPAMLRDHARLALLDSIGCAIFGSQFEWVRITTGLALEGGIGPVTVLGSGRGAAAGAAALANGTAIHSFELDDVILGSLSHAGAAVIPAVLAAAELSDATGDDLLAGIVAGYELDARIGTALGGEPIGLGFHTTSVAGPLAGALAACIVSGASADVVASALGIAISTSSGLKAFQQGTGGMVKRLHGGLGASNAVLAWQLATRGFDGPREAIDGKFGLMEVFAPKTGRHEAYSENLDENWSNWGIVRNWIKMFPCCALIHTTCQAVDAIRVEEGLSADDVVSVRVGTSARCVIQNGDMDPQEAMGAQYSIPFNAALALTGDVRDPNAFLEGQLHDPALREMIGRIELYVDDEVEATYPDSFGAKVQVNTRDGRQIDRTCWYAHGTPADPCTADEIRAKFRKLTSARISSEAAEALIAAVDGLGDRASLQVLMQAIRQCA